MGGRSSDAALPLVLLGLQVVHCAVWRWSPPGNCKLPHDRNSWCCARKHCTGAEYGEPCPEIPIPLTHSCKGECYHDHEYTFVSACENSTICLKDWELCLGTHQCEDRGDLNWCRQPNRKLEECPVTHDILFRKYSDTSDPPPKVRCEGAIPGQCIEKRKKRDGTTYHCFDRSDEPLLKSSAELERKLLNLAEIQTCDINPQQPGLRCGDECVAMSEWCKQSTARRCSNLDNRSTTDPELCSNFSFWSGKDCGVPNFYRCTGRWSGQCGDHGKPCHVFIDTICETGEKCIDKSDQFWLLEQKQEGKDWQPKECTTSQGEPGLTCFSAPDQRCLELTKWCNRFNAEMARQEVSPFVYHLGFTPIYPTVYQCGPGKSNTSLSISICGNSTLMANAPCPGGAKRCTGGYMECMPDNWDLGLYGIPPSCLDGSDKNLSLSFSVLDITKFSTSFSSSGSYKTFLEKNFAFGNASQESISEDPLRVYDRFITIRDNIESVTVEECAKRQGFPCVRSNTKVCINSDLRCNKHPDCDDASDEDGCEERNLLVGFRCPSPHHNEENEATFTPWVTISATRCDLEPECWGGLDEYQCNNDWAVYYVIGKNR